MCIMNTAPSPTPFRCIHCLGCCPAKKLVHGLAPRVHPPYAACHPQCVLPLLSNHAIPQNCAFEPHLALLPASGVEVLRAYLCWAQTGVRLALPIASLLPAMLERHLLERSSGPRQMVPTTVANLVYLDRPSANSTELPADHLAMLGSLMDQPIRNGY